MNYKIKALDIKSGLPAPDAFEEHIGRSGDIWWVGIGPYAGDRIWVKVDGVMRKSNSQSLLEDTGINVTDKHQVFCCIALSIEPEGFMNGTMVDVIYMDDTWVEKPFNHGEQIAQEYADLSGKSIVLYKQTAGGSGLTRIEPKVKQDNAA